MALLCFAFTDDSQSSLEKSMAVDVQTPSTSQSKAPQSDTCKDTGNDTGIYVHIVNSVREQINICCVCTQIISMCSISAGFTYNIIPVNKCPKCVLK